jgi:DNA-directed RNA polymerase specialized sigma24 family protein
MKKTFGLDSRNLFSCDGVELMASRTPVGFRKWLNIDGEALPLSVLQIVDEMQSWIEGHVSRHLRLGASTWEFRERFCERLKKKVPSAASASQIRALIHKTVTDLIHDQNRTEFRRDNPAGNVWAHVLLDQYADPQSGAAEQKFLRESEALAVLRAMRKEDRTLVEQLYGLRNIDKVPRAEMAKKLGIQRDTLDQRLHRIFHSVRKVIKP